MTVVETLGWVLLHFAWQGAVAAAALWMALLLLPSGRASLRYALGCATLLLMAVSPLVTAAGLTASHAEPRAEHPHAGDRAVNFPAGDTALDARPGETSAFVRNVGLES